MRVVGRPAWFLCTDLYSFMAYSHHANFTAYCAVFATANFHLALQLRLF
jgi:hypothetical protein